MGINFRRRKKIAPGVRINFNKRGISTTIGGKAFRVTAGSNGASVGSSIPGTGIYYHKKLSSRNKRPARTRYEEIQQHERQKEKVNEAKQQVEKFEAHIEMLQSVHEEVNDRIDWKDIATSVPPFITGEYGPHTKKALQNLDQFTPSFFDKLFQRTKRMEAKLQEEVVKAKEKDEKLYNDWMETKELAISVISGDRNAWAAALQHIQPFQDIEQLGSKVKWTFSREDLSVTVQVNIRTKEAVPRKNLSLTKTGKVSQRNMPKKQYFQLYQDYVSSCALRIAREFFAILPLEMVTIHIYDEVEKDGVTDYGCILSVQLPRKELEQTVFENIDCSDTIETFPHRMRFLKTKGFQIVEEIQ